MKERKLMKRTLHYLKPYLFLFILLSLLMAAGYLIIFSSIGVLLRQIMRLIQNDSFDSHQMRKILLYLLAVACVSPLTGFTRYGTKCIERKVGDAMRADMLHAYLNGEETTVEKYKVQDVHNRMRTDADTAASWCCGYNMSGWVLEPIFSGILSTIYLCFIDWRIAVLCLLCALANLFIVQLFSKEKKEMERKITEEQSDLTTFMKEGVDGAEEVRTFSIQQLLEGKLSSKIQQIVSHQRKRDMYTYVRGAAIGLFGDCVLIGMILMLGAYLASKNIISFPNVMMAVPLSDQMCQMMVSFGLYFVIEKQQAVHEERIFEIVDLPQMKKTETTEKDAAVFEHVRYSYGQKEVLHDVSFRIRRGEKAAIVGETGSGKSTVMKLLLGVLSPDTGKVETPVPQEISYISQESSLFHQSIAVNIAMDQHPDMDKVKKAAEEADCDFILQKEKGFEDIPSGEKSDLSGGQIQRIALARAFYSNRKVIFMDEPTSALDQASSEIITNVLNNLKKDKTLFVITHRLDLIRHFDHILVMQNGKIMEEGNHNTLMEKNGVYASLWKKETERKSK